MRVLAALIVVGTTLAIPFDKVRIHARVVCAAHRVEANRLR